MTRAGHGGSDGTCLLHIDAHNLRGGGGLTHLRSLLEHVPANTRFERIEVHVGAWGREHLSHLTDGRVEVKWVRALDGGLASRVAWHQRRLPPLLAADEPSLLFSPGGLLPRRIPRQTRSVTMCRNMLPFQAEEVRRYGIRLRRLRMRILRSAQLGSFRRADGVIFASEFSRERVGRLAGGRLGHAAVIPHGIDDQFSAVVRDHEPDPARMELLYVSPIEPYKHHLQVIRAVERLREVDFPGLTLRLIGWAYDPELRRVQKYIREKGLADVVEYEGEVPYADLPSAYGRARASVFASSCENCPNTLLEAMAAGVPIACSDRPPMPEFAGNAVVYFDPEDPEAVARALREVLGDEELRRSLAVRQRSRARSFTWDGCARDTFAFLEEIARGVA